MISLVGIELFCQCILLHTLVEISTEWSKVPPNLVDGLVEMSTIVWSKFQPRVVESSTSVGRCIGRNVNNSLVEIATKIGQKFHQCWSMHQAKCRQIFG